MLNPIDSQRTKGFPGAICVLIPRAQSKIHSPEMSKVLPAVTELHPHQRFAEVTIPSYSEGDPIWKQNLHRLSKENIVTKMSSVEVLLKDGSWCTARCLRSPVRTQKPMEAKHLTVAEVRKDSLLVTPRRP